ncbi:MAG: hypothetical protein EBX88_05560 [Actinobacteria bacterium]|nr:hypothetical protein [Actinomycetota bacterium]
MSRADLGKDPEAVATMFDAVARRYDLVNDLLSLGRTKAWRKKVVKIIKPTSGMKILDIAAGPGSSSEVTSAPALCSGSLEEPGPAAISRIFIPVDGLIIFTTFFRHALVLPKLNRSFTRS